MPASESNEPDAATPLDRRQPRSPARYGVLFVRYGIGLILVLVGIVLLIVSPGGFGIDGFGLAVGAGLSVLMLNYLYRLGVTGDDERRREEEARRYLAQHGHWPDERSPEPDERSPEPEQADDEHRTRHDPSRRHRRSVARPPRRRGPA